MAKRYRRRDLVQKIYVEYHDPISDNIMESHGIWRRLPKMDDYADEILKLHRISNQMERRFNLNPQNLKIDYQVGNVIHIGHGVFWQKHTIPIDKDSQIDPTTITRIETRQFARECIQACLYDPKAKGTIVGVGQPGIGKTRGTLTFTLQELLSNEEVVIRVGQWTGPTKSGLPIRLTIGPIQVLSRDCQGDQCVFIVVDPPENGGYKWMTAAMALVIKYASNNSRKHYHNIRKDGCRLFTAPPSLDEMKAQTHLLKFETVFPTRRPKSLAGANRKGS